MGCDHNADLVQLAAAMLERQARSADPNSHRRRADKARLRAVELAQALKRARRRIKFLEMKAGER